MFVNINNHVFLDSALKWAVPRYCRLAPPSVILCSIESNQRRGGMYESKGIGASVKKTVNMCTFLLAGQKKTRIFKFVTLL